MFPITCNAIGDVIALATLILDVIRALDETRGSVPEYSDFVGELRAMHTMLAAVARVVQDTMDGVLRNEIVSEVDHCGKDVQRALARIVRFSALESAGASSSSMRVQLARQWYKLEWRFSQRGKSEVVRAELRAATQRLTTLLVISNADGAARFRSSLAGQFRALVERDAAHSRVMGGIRSMLGELQVSSRRNHVFVEELFKSAPEGIDSKTVAVAVLCVAVCAMHGTNRTVPTALLLVAICLLLRSGRRHARALVNEVTYTELNAVTLFDALGRRLVLPIELCETYDILHATLFNLFARTSGRWFVETRAYDITDVRTAKLVCFDNWGSIVRVGAKVEMSVIVQQVISNRKLVQCPWCLGPTLKDEVENGMKCIRCHRSFQVTTRGQLISDLNIVFGTCNVKNDGVDMNTRGFTHTVAGSPGKQPYSGDLWPSIGGELMCSLDEKLLVDSGPWQTHTQELKRIRILCDRFVSDIASDNLQNELHLAAGNGHLALLRVLLDQGADVDTRDRLGHTPLHYAANRGHMHVMELLLNRGARIDAVPSVNYLTPLACVVWRRQSMAAKMLLARGALVSASNSSKRTALYASASVGNVETARMIIQMGVDVNSLDNTGKTALHRAIQGNDCSMIEMLLQHGADMHARSQQGDTPLSLASKEGNEEVMKLLLAAGAISDVPSTV